MSWVSASGSTIFVYDRIRGSRTGGKRYRLACSKCSSDTELFPEITMHRTGTKNNKTSCACSSKAIYSEDQYRVICRRKAKSLGVDFIGFDNGFNREKTKVVSFCNQHKEQNIAIIGSFLSRFTCCNHKALESSLISRNLTQEEFTKKAMASGSFQEGTEFKRVALTSYWEVHCPACKSDQYAQAGIKSIWVAIGASIITGRIQCRCSARHCWTKEEYEKRIEMCGVEFAGWSGGYIGNSHKDRFIARCSAHGDRLVSVSAAINGRGCPGCAKTGFDTSKNAFLYCLKSDDGAFLKIGITGNKLDRLARLKRNTPFSFSVLWVKDIPGDKARDAEKSIHDKLMSAGFRGFEGATEWFRYDDVTINKF